MTSTEGRTDNMAYRKASRLMNTDLLILQLRSKAPDGHQFEDLKDQLA
jgi:hypothetical protein